MAPMVAPIPIPAFAPVDRPEEDDDEPGDPGDPGESPAGDPLPPFSGIDWTPEVAGPLFPLVPVAPGLALVTDVPPFVAVVGTSPALKLSWMSGAKRTKLDCTLPPMVRGKVTSLKSLYAPSSHLTVEKEAEVTVSTHVCAYVLETSIEEQVKPVGQHAAAVSPASIEYSMPQPEDPPAVAMATVVKPAGQT